VARRAATLRATAAAEPLSDGRCYSRNAPLGDPLHSALAALCTSVSLAAAGSSLQDGLLNSPGRAGRAAMTMR
jgi:hypothetical protein